MSVLTDPINNNPDVQIWNNSAFDDNGDQETFKETFSLYNNNNNNNQMIKSPSWLFSKKPVNLSEDSLNSSFSSKENRSPVGFSKPCVGVNQLKVFGDNNAIKIGKIFEKQDFVENVEMGDEESAIEDEIRRLYARLEVIRAQKKNVKIVEKEVFGVKKIQESRNEVRRRGVSMGPNEIMGGTSLKAKQSGVTPCQGVQNRRKSCFWKLDDIAEEKSRRAVTTVGGKKGVKKDESVIGSVQPKKLFGERSVPAKKSVKPGRVIPSRYNQATVNSLMKNVDRKSRGGTGTEGRVKKKWDIPSVNVVPKRLSLEDEEEDLVERVDVVLPRIKVVRCVEEAGRDSGPAKRVAELVGKRSYFKEEAVCQELSFDED